MNEVTKKNIIKNIDWILDGSNDEPSRASSWPERVPIGDGSIKGYRLFTGKHDCGYYAILYALADNKNAAIEWLQAAQSHNPGAKEEFNAYKDFAIEYLLGKKEARENVLKRAAIGDGGNLIVQAINWLKKNLKGQNKPTAEEPKKIPDDHFKRDWK